VKSHNAAVLSGVSQNRTGAMLVGLALAAQLAITVPLAKILNTWIDESYTLRTTGQSLAYAVHQAIHFELQAPLYFAVLAIWRSLDHSIFFARLFSVICAALLTLCAAPLARRFVPSVNPLWATLFVALNPATIWAALEIRCYAFGGLLSALILWTFFDGFMSQKQTRNARIAHVIVAIAAIYTQYFLGFVLLGTGASLVAGRQWERLRRYLFWLCAVAIGVIPLAYVLHAQISAGTSNYFSTMSLPWLLFEIFQLMVRYALPVQLVFSGAVGLWLGRLVNLMGLAAIVFTFWRVKRGALDAGARTAWIVATVTGLMLAIAFWATKEPFSYRYLFIVFAPVMLAAIATLADLQERLRHAIISWATVFVLASLATVFVSYRPLAKGGDWMRVAAYLERSERPGQPIWVFQTENALPLADYYHGINAIVPIPRPIDFQMPWNENVTVHSDADLDQDFSSVPGPHEYIWVVNTGECRDFSVDYNCPVFEHYLSTHFYLIRTQGFYHSQVRLLRLKALGRGSPPSP